MISDILCESTYYFIGTNTMNKWICRRKYAKMCDEWCVHHTSNIQLRNAVVNCVQSTLAESGSDCHSDGSKAIGIPPHMPLLYRTFSMQECSPFVGKKDSLDGKKMMMDHLKFFSQLFFLFFSNISRRRVKMEIYKSNHFYYLCNVLPK